MFKLNKLSVLTVLAVLVLLAIPASGAAQEACVIRPALDDATSLALYATPGSGVVMTLTGDDAGVELPALAVTEDGTGNLWYKLDVSALSTINTTAWIRAGAVELMSGNCSGLAEGEDEPLPDEDGGGMSWWLTALISIVAGLGAVAIGIVAFNWWRNHNIVWLPDAVEDALRNFIYKAILSAYRLSEATLDEIGERLEGADKKAIADSFYRLIPDQIAGFDVSLIKRLVPQERFEELVQQVFDEFYTFYVGATGHLDELFEGWQQTEADIHPQAEEPAA
jgi:hypothetical protein